MKRLNIDIDENILKALKIKALEEDKTIKVFLTEMILERLYRENK